MQRRHLLKASLALAAYTGIPSTGLFALQAFANPANGDGQAFDFDWLKQHAKELAGQAYQPTAQKLPDTLANMTPQQFNAIGYDAQHSLWHDLKGQLDVQFFHVGMGFKTPVRMFSVDPKTNEAKEVHFRPELFNYNDSGVDKSQLQAVQGAAPGPVRHRLLPRRQLLPRGGQDPPVRAVGPWPGH